MKNKVLLLILSSFLLACNKESNCLKSAGDARSQKRVLESFKHLHIRDNVIVELKNDSNYFVEVDFNEQLMDGISTRIKNEVLEIDNKNRCRWVKDLSIRPRITVHMPLNELLTIHHYGSEELMMHDSLRAERFTFEQFDAAGDAHLKLKVAYLELKQHAGNANLEVVGTCDKLYLYNISLGKTDASALVASEGYIISNSIQEITAGPSLFARCELYNSGSIKLCPQPDSIVVVKRGLGELVLCP